MDRLAEILEDEAGGDWAELANVLEAAIDGYVCRHGLAVHDHSGWDPWEYFELAAVASPAKLRTNLAAGRAAAALGNVAPVKRKDHRKARRREDPEAARKKREAEAAEVRSLEVERARLDAMTAEERAALEVEIWEKAPASAFRDRRLAVARSRAAELNACRQ
jgi:hypothetical protein